MRLKHLFYVLPLRLRSLFRRNQVEKELDEEMQYHLERQIEFHRAAVLALGRFQLSLGFEVARLVEMRPRRRQHRALQRDSVVGIVGIRLGRGPVVFDRDIEVAGLRRVVPLAERSSCCAAR